MAIQVETQTKSTIKNIAQFIIFSAAIAFVVAAPFALVVALFLVRGVTDPIEKKYRQWCVALATCCFIAAWNIVLIHLMPDWWIINHWPTFWGAICDISHHEGIVSDGITCFILIWPVESVVKHYGSSDEDFNYQHPQWHKNQLYAAFNRELQESEAIKYQKYRETFRAQYGANIEDIPMITEFVGTIAREPDEQTKIVA